MTDSDALRALYVSGRETWPTIALDLAAFSAAAMSRLDDVPIDEIRPGELYLAIACALRVDGAIAEFDKHYLAELTSILTRSGHDAAAAADAVQTLRVRFLVGDAVHGPRIAEYDGRSSLATWLRVAAVRIAISARRKGHRETAIDAETFATEPSPELDLLHRRFGAEFDAAFRTTFEALAPRDRRLLRYQVRERLGIDRIAAIYGVHRATAARWVARARQALVDGVRSALQTRFHIDSSELDSLVRVLHSRLDISISLWATTPTPARSRIQSD